MSFPVNSTGTITPAISRVSRVLQRAKVGSGKTRLIKFGGVFNCRTIAGSDTYSQHAWGNAIDLFPEHQSNDELRAIADAVVVQATKSTIANLGRKIPVSQVIDHNNRRIWTPSFGWKTYTGSYGAHVHVSGEPLRLGTPPCAG